MITFISGRKENILVKGVYFSFNASFVLSDGKATKCTEFEKRKKEKNNKAGKTERLAFYRQKTQIN